uniref:Uncharacterized protein n=1 Tax=Trichobilharzia regenti TaxID=157069 RepID=A0AA85JBJ2_TRIRE
KRKCDRWFGSYTIPEIYRGIYGRVIYGISPTLWLFLALFTYSVLLRLGIVHQ